MIGWLASHTWVAEWLSLLSFVGFIGSIKKLATAILADLAPQEKSDFDLKVKEILTAIPDCYNGRFNANRTPNVDEVEWYHIVHMCVKQGLLSGIDTTTTTTPPSIKHTYINIELTLPGEIALDCLNGGNSKLRKDLMFFSS